MTTMMRMMNAMLRTHGASSTGCISRRLLPSAAVPLRHFHSGARLWQQQQQKVSIELVKQLRKETDAPLGQCKKALEESGGDMSAAKEWLRRKGVQLAQKKMGREAVQGLVAVAVDTTGGSAATHGAMVEVNSETDFVMRNDKFQGAVAQIVQTALRCREEDVEKLQTAEVAEGGTVGEALADLVGAIGENIQLRRVRIVAAEEGGLVAKYVHNAVADDMGQMGAIVAVKPVPGASAAAVDHDAMSSLARSLAMHITALMPRWLSREDVPTEVIEKEQSILRDKALNEGKDEKYLDRVIAGQLNKFYQENVLLDQGWVMDDKVSVAKFLAENGVQVTGYARFKTGQQLQEAEDDKAE